jgi:predicted flap endonuclease-1-like 5' DNA nuclease
MCDDFEVEATKAEMLRVGGKTEVYSVPEATAADLTAAAAAQTQAADAVDEAVSYASRTVDSVVDTAKSGVSGVVDTGTAAVAGLAAAVGLNAVDSDKLAAAGVDKASTLLKTASTPQGRAALASETGLDVAEIYTSVKKVDLMRVKGVGQKYASLLVASGVDSVPELGTRNAANLTAKMTEVNGAGTYVDNLPSEAEVSDWVAQAKTMEKMVF